MKTAQYEPTLKHEFALYVKAVSATLKVLSKGSLFTIEDDALCHRISNVLRLQVNDTVILFDRSINAHCAISAIQGKRKIVFELLSKENNNYILPKITCVLPLLKRDNLEEALSVLAELGVNAIQLVITDKSIKSWGKEKDIERIERIVVAAAEQSKCFIMPEIKAPLLLEDFCAQSLSQESINIYFDAQGEPLLQCMNKGFVSDDQIQQQSFVLMVGPEADLTISEKELVRKNGFIFCKLTPTVLRAVHAVCVGVGAFRSL